MIAAGWWLGCAHRSPSWAPRGAAVEWASAAVTTIDATTVEEQHTVRVAPLGRGRFEVRTARSTVDIEGPTGRQTFASEAPGGADPWPLVLQHAIAATPATLVQTRDGGLRLEDPEGWSEAAKDALLRTSLPPAAVSTGLPLVDPPGFEAELRRWFPGVPADGSLVRRERIAGVDAERREACTERREGAARIWRCEGAATDGEGHLRELESWTELVADRRGLRSVESGWGGILSGPGGLVPIVSRRVILRRDEGAE